MKDFRLENSVSFTNALKLILTKVKSADKLLNRDKELLDTASCLHRNLAEDIVSNTNVPNFDNSAVDGYGLRAEDLADFNNGKKFVVFKEIFAGDLDSYECPKGSVVAIMTGAPIPKNLECIVMLEHVDITSKNGQKAIMLKQNAQPQKIGSNIRLRGEDIKKDKTLFKSGRILSSADLGVLVSLNISKVSVKSKIKIGYFSTGDEVQQLGKQLEIGQVYDSNSILIQSLCNKFGYEFFNFGIVRDKPELLHSAFLAAVEEVDIIITSGGVSTGEADYVRKILAELGKVEFWKLAVKPGRPLAFGTLQDKLVFGLPGNPTATMTIFYQLVMPALHYILAKTEYEPFLVEAVASSNFKSLKGRYEFARGKYECISGKYFVKSAGKSGSGILTTMSEANCFVHLTDDLGDIQAGTMVLIQPFNSF